MKFKNVEVYFLSSPGLLQVLLEVETSKVNPSLFIHIQTEILILPSLIHRVVQYPSLIPFIFLYIFLIYHGQLFRCISSYHFHQSCWYPIIKIPKKYPPPLTSFIYLNTFPSCSPWSNMMKLMKRLLCMSPMNHYFTLSICSPITSTASTPAPTLTPNDPSPIYLELTYSPVP